MIWGSFVDTHVSKISFGLSFGYTTCVAPSNSSLVVASIFENSTFVMLFLNSASISIVSTSCPWYVASTSMTLSLEAYPIGAFNSRISYFPKGRSALNTTCPLSSEIEVSINVPFSTTNFLAISVIRGSLS